MSESARYDDESVQVLEGVEHVRKRPGMYIGDTAHRGLHHLVYEVVDNSIDEAMAGACRNIRVAIGADGSVLIEDDGRGIPVGVKDGYQISTLELCLTKLGAGAKFDRDTYKVSGGLHGVGVSVVNALSEWLTVESSREGKTWAMRFERGKTVGPLEAIAETEQTGTRIVFLPDREIFPEPSFSYKTLADRLRELAYLNSGLTISIRDERDNREELFRFERGIGEFVEHLNEGKEPVHPPVYFEREDRAQRLICEVALQYTDTYNTNEYSFVNNINTVEGGTHLSGFRASLTRAVNGYAKKAGLLKANDPVPTGEDIREGLTAVISVKVPEPQFEGQTKTKLGNGEVGTFVETTVNEMLGNYLEEHPAEAKRLVNKAVQAAVAREAARKARETARKSVMSGAGMSRKLVDCSSRDVDETELFIVEGDSAAGSAKGYRNAQTQAILPIRGKILNVEKSRLHKILSHEEILEIIKALGTGIGEEDFDLSKLRYGRIILMTDADVDGSHIRTLLLTFLFRHMRALIDKGVVYIAQPPLFQIAKGKKVEYVLDDGALDRKLTEFGLGNTSLEVRRAGQAARRIEGGELARLVELVKRIERQADVLARRGILFEPFYRGHCRDGKLPPMRASIDDVERFCWDEAEFAEFRRQHAGDGRAVARANLTECGALEVAFAELAEFGCSAADLFLRRQELDTGERTAAEFCLLNSQADEQEIENLRELPEGIRKLGSRGSEIKRFKGLGEMNKEELWSTTMDPANRVMWKVVVSESADDVEQLDIDNRDADHMFAVLMGDDVERRREFIARNAVNVKNLDV
ncbi:MAG: Type 2 topoisomerase subunit B [Phycisphaerae bacterium]|nr:Type 2 topoisomerase subunit B [Phycisphaerae bacterium]